MGATMSLKLVILSRAGVTGWAISPRGGEEAPYPSLYSPQLREWVSHEPEGTTIGLYTNPAAITPPHNSPVEQELTDFGTFCKAHRLHFFYLPVA